MNCRFTDLRHKEVISACDGTRIGFIDDVIVDTKCATVVSIVISADRDFLVWWENVRTT